MKRIICLLVFAATFVTSAFAQTDFVFTDASTLPLFGKIRADTFEPYSRFPESLKESVRDGVWKLGRNSSGLYIRFKSDTARLKFRWRPTFNADLDNMTGVGVRGMALYVLDEGKWEFVYPVRPKKKGDVFEYSDNASLLDGQEHEYMLYLSLYDGVLDLQIGVPEGRTIAPSTLNSPRAEKPIITYGTSILQGASASNAGMCGTAQLSRKANRQVINLGFSGNCLLEAPIAEFMASYADPGMYIIDNWNGDVKIGEQGLEKCIRILRAAHPETVILIVDRPKAACHKYDATLQKGYYEKRDLAAAVVAKIRKEGDKNIYHITPEVLGEGGSGTCDGCHFNDAAFEKWVEAILPVVKKAYKKVK